MKKNKKEKVKKQKKNKKLFTDVWLFGFSADKFFGMAPLTVNFKADGSQSSFIGPDGHEYFKYDYYWDFGDGREGSQLKTNEKELTKSRFAQ